MTFVLRSQAKLMDSLGHIKSVQPVYLPVVQYSFKQKVLLPFWFILFGDGIILSVPCPKYGPDLADLSCVSGLLEIS